MLLTLKVIVEERFIDPSGSGDLVDPRTGQAEPGKLLQGGRDNCGFGDDGISSGPARLLSRESFHLMVNVTNYLVNCNSLFGELTLRQRDGSALYRSSV